VSHRGVIEELGAAIIFWQEQLRGSRAEDENRTVHGLRHQITLECLMNRHAIPKGDKRHSTTQKALLILIEN